MAVPAAKDAGGDIPLIVPMRRPGKRTGRLVVVMAPIINDAMQQDLNNQLDKAAGLVPLSFFVKIGRISACIYPTSN